VTDWNPIETAPKDGTWVELLADEAGTRDPVSRRQWRRWQFGSHDPMWEDHWVDEIGQIRRNLTYTHWRPCRAPGTT
jgi:hypothetical protein